MKHSLAYLSVLLIVLFSACSEFSKISKSDDVNKKLAAAIRYYEKKDYQRSILLLDEIYPMVKGTKDAETVAWYFANSYFRDKQYLMSAYYFRDYYENFPRSPKAEEAMFLFAKSRYLDSPGFNLDQTNSFDALDAIQTFANKYPRSVFMEEANQITDELNAKIEFKEYEGAKLYYRLRKYKSAIVTFSNFLEFYPSSKYAEEVAFLRLDAQFQLAKNSVIGPKQEQRFFETIEFYNSFVDIYSNSKFKKEAERIFKDSSNYLENIKQS